MQNIVTLVRLRDSQSSSSSSLRSPSQIVAETVKQSKGKIVTSLATLGFYDLVIVAEYPDLNSAFKASATLKTHGWITETMAAEDLSSFDQIYAEAQRETTTSGSSQRRP